VGVLGTARHCQERTRRCELRSRRWCNWGMKRSLAVVLALAFAVAAPAAAKEGTQAHLLAPLPAHPVAATFITALRPSQGGVRPGISKRAAAAELPAARAAWEAC
jgi:hypothetical protein